MSIVIALGGNALLKRDEPLEAKRLRENSLRAAKNIAKVANLNEVVIVHGNGPQIGLLALQAEAYKGVPAYPFDILGAESQGMIGYILQQALNYYLPLQSIVTLITQVIVDQNDPAFKQPSKPIGLVYKEAELINLKQRYPNWQLQLDGKGFRRVVPSPKPQEIYELAAIHSLQQQHVLVIAGGGGGIPCIKGENQRLTGVEAVIDKDLTASLLAQKLKAELFIILTDVDAVYKNWGTPKAHPIQEMTPQQLMQLEFAKGSMQPKVEAACQFVQATNKLAVIGHVDQLENIRNKKSGTLIHP